MAAGLHRIWYPDPRPHRPIHPSHIGTHQSLWPSSPLRLPPRWAAIAAVAACGVYTAAPNAISLFVTDMPTTQVPLLSPYPFHHSVPWGGSAMKRGLLANPLFPSGTGTPMMVCALWRGGRRGPGLAPVLHFKEIAWPPTLPLYHQEEVQHT